MSENNIVLSSFYINYLIWLNKEIYANITFTDEELNQNEILEENFNDNLGEVVVFKDDEKYKFEKILKSNSIIYGKTNKKVL